MRANHGVTVAREIDMRPGQDIVGLLWLRRLTESVRDRFDFERQRSEMLRFAQLDERFPADIGLTADELERGPVTKARERCAQSLAR